MSKRNRMPKPKTCYCFKFKGKVMGRDISGCYPSKRRAQRKAREASRAGVAVGRTKRAPAIKCFGMRS